MKTLIAIPCMDMIHTTFFKSMIALERVGECKYGMTQSSLIYAARNTLARQAVAEDFDRVLWFDSDMDIPPDAMKRLSQDIDEGREFVSGIYFKRTLPTAPVLYNELGYFDDEGHVTPVAKPYHDYPRDQIFEIQAAGFGCVMMTVDLIRKVNAKFGQPFSPMMGFGEDLSFCARVLQLGIPMYCDSRIKCGHVSAQLVTEESFLQGMV